MSTPTIDHMIHTLSEISLYYRYHPAHRPPTNTAISKDNRRRLKMLTLISLLIVTEGSGDAAAVSLYATAGKRIELCYSKNRPCTPDETAYVTELFAIATNPTSSTQTKFTDLFNLVLCKCKDKIIARLHKLCSRIRALGEPDDFAFTPLILLARRAPNPVATQPDAKIRHFVGATRFPPDSSLVDFLSGWFSRLRGRLQHDFCFDLQANKHLVHETITICHFLAEEPQVAPILDMTLLDRIRKLGEYYAAITVLVREVRKLNSGGGESGVSIKEVVPPPPETQFSCDFLAILNQCARDNGTTKVTERDLKKAYCRRGEPPATTEVVLKASVHCECSLALAFANSHLSSLVPTMLVIGTSKSMCWSCREFLTTFHDSYPHITIHVSSYTKRLRRGWALPPGTPSKVVNTMRKGLEDLIQHVLTTSVRTPDFYADDSSDDSEDLDSEYIQMMRETPDWWRVLGLSKIKRIFSRFRQRKKKKEFS